MEASSGRGGLSCTPIPELMTFAPPDPRAGHCAGPHLPLLGRGSRSSAPLGTCVHPLPAPRAASWALSHTGLPFTNPPCRGRRRSPEGKAALGPQLNASRHFATVFHPFPRAREREPQANSGSSVESEVVT